MALTRNELLPMALVKRMLVRAMFGIVLLAIGNNSRAQGTFQIRFDTVLAKSGDTVTLAARYTFVPSGPHNIISYSAILDWDTSEIHLLAFVLDSTTATPASDTNLGGTSHRGISAYGSSEIDLTNPVLFKIRFLVDRRLADTAFVRWDPNSDLIDPSEGVGTVIRQDGWIRTASSAGHILLRTPAVTVKGYSNGFTADSVAFDLPFVVSTVSMANMHDVRLSFTFDSTRIVWGGPIVPGNENLTFDSATFTRLISGLDSCTIDLTSRAGVIQGGDTLLTLRLEGRVGFDTICEVLSNVSLRSTDSNAFIGNLDYTGNPICLEWEPLMSVSEANNIRELSVYPNPATSEVWIGSDLSDGSLDVYDRLGRLVFSGKLDEGLWRIPPNVASGIYEAILHSGDTLEKAKIVIR